MIEKLTARESQILTLIAEGMSNKLIGQKLFISESTVENHVHNIYRKLAISNRAQATAYVFNEKMTVNNKVERKI